MSRRATALGANQKIFDQLYNFFTCSLKNKLLLLQRIHNQ